MRSKVRGFYVSAREYFFVSLVFISSRCAVNGVTSRDPMSNGHARMAAVDLRKRRAEIVIWKRPITTLQYFVLEFSYQMGNLAYRLSQHKAKVTVAVILLALSTFGYYAEGPHQKVILFFCFEPFELPLPYSCSYSIICLI
jgi:hypothetical protein